MTQSAVSREEVFAALFALASTAAAFNTKSRTLLDWSEVPAQKQPALFQTEGRQAGVSERGIPAKWELYGELIIYCHAGNLPEGITDVVVLLNQQVDAVVNSIELPRIIVGYNSMGGVVGDVRVQGDIETSEGRLGQQAVAIIPVQIQPLT